MYTNVSSSFLSKIAQPSRHFEARFYDGNTLLDLEILHIDVTTGTCGGSNLAVGCAFAGYLTVSARYTDIQLEGKELKLELGLLLDDSTYEYIPFGYWTVQKPTVQKDIMSFTAVDRMASKFNEDYSSSLTYPATIASVLSELSTATGVTINCNLQTSLQMPTKIVDVSQRGALAVIANCLLACAWVDRNGMVNITAYGNSSTQAVVDYDYVKEQPSMDEKETVISGVKVYTVDGQTDTWVETGTDHMITTSNVYTTQTILDATADNIVGLEYNGGSVKFMGNPLLDPSDTITFNDGESDQYIPCMEITQTFDGGLLTTITAPGSFEVTESTIQTGPIAQEMERRAKATAEAQATADEALTTAEDAATAAEDAMVLATGKSKIFYSATAPTSGMSSGDMWMKLDGSNALYQYSGSSWTLRQFGQGSIVAGSITGNEIYGNTLSAITAHLGTVNTGQLQSENYVYGEGPYFCQSGMIVNLDNQTIMTPKFSVIGGVLRATDGIFSGQITTKSGTIGGYTISSASNTGTTANGGHVYTNSLYTHSSDSTYEYESGLAGGGAYNNAAFYIRRIEIGDPWSSSDYMFYVRNDGYLYATKGSIAGSLITRGIDASNITAGTISASVIAANSISVSKLTGSISRDNWVIDLDAGSLTIGNISAENINAGTLNAARIAANSIAVEKLTGIIKDAGNTWEINLTTGDMTVGNISASNINTGTLTAIEINNGNGTFSVTSAGALTASNATITGSVIVNSGTIGGFSISSTSNTGTTANGGHHYTKSLYVHSTGTEGSTSYEYEAGLTGNNSSTAANFYVRRIASGAAWSTSELRFYVRNDGYLRAITGKIGPWTFSETSIYKSGGYQSATAGSAYFGDSGLSVTDKFYVTAAGAVYCKGGTLNIVDNTSSDLARIVFPSGSIGNGGSGTVIEDTYEIDLIARGDSGGYYGLISLHSKGMLSLMSDSGGISISGSPSITGTVTADANYYRRDSGYTRGTAPSSSRYSAYVFTDKNGAVVSYMESAVWTSGTHALRFNIYAPTATGSATTALSLENNATNTITCSIAGDTSITGHVTSTLSMTAGTASFTSAIAVGARNSTGMVQLYVSSNGAKGVYNATLGKYIIRHNSDSTPKVVIDQLPASTTTSAGNVYSSAVGTLSLSSASSRRYKKEIKPLSDWKSVLDIPVVSFKYRDNYLSKEDQRYGMTVPGFIAEEVDEHYAVAADRVEGKVHDWNARYIIPPMLAVEQDHEKRIRELEDEIRRLKGEVA